jgi:hypothetical protein
VHLQVDSLNDALLVEVQESVLFVPCVVREATGQSNFVGRH